MDPSCLHRMVWEYGEHLADNAYLFADPFTRPVSFANGALQQHHCSEGFVSDAR
jgi:hypothetical protein